MTFAVGDSWRMSSSMVIRLLFFAFSITDMVSSWAGLAERVGIESWGQGVEPMPLPNLLHGCAQSSWQGTGLGRRA